MKKVLFLFVLLYGNLIIAQEVVAVDMGLEQKATQIATDFLASQQIPGMSIAVSKNGKMLWSKGFGYTDIHKKTLVDPAKTQFRLASISKPITAVGLAILVDTKQLDYDESLYTYLPDFPKKKYDFTIRQVGGHIAGIRHYKGQEFIISKKMTITEGLAIFKNDPLAFEPRTKYQYSTYGWNLLSEVIQTVAKTAFNQFMIEQIFNPLEMNSTRLDSFEDAMPNRTNFYVKNHQGNIYLAPKVSNEHKVAGGGFVATSEDLINFGNEIIDPKIISKESLKELLTAQKTKDGKSTNYGIGFAIRKSSRNTPSFSHSGGGAGATTLLLIYPEERIVIAMLTNLSQVPIRRLGEKLETLFLN